MWADCIVYKTMSLDRLSIPCQHYRRRGNRRYRRIALKLRTQHILPNATQLLRQTKSHIYFDVTLVLFNDKTLSTEFEIITS